MKKQFNYKGKIGAISLRIFSILFVTFLMLSATKAQDTKIMIFDTFHGQNPKNAETFRGLLTKKTKSSIVVSQTSINDSILQGKHALILFSPTKPFAESEKQVIIKFLNEGGSLLLIFDEERRTKLEVGVNDLIKPFGMEFTTDAPVKHNCGAIAEKGKITKKKRELPYSGGRSIIGGEIVSRVNEEGNYIHCAYKTTEKKGKIILMSDGMAGLLLGSKDGVRFSGTNPSDSKYWGKDSKIFMEEIFAFLVK